MKNKVYKKVRKWLLMLDSESNYDFKSILDILEESNIPIREKNLRNALALATFDGIYIDIKEITNLGFEDKLISFILLHEIAHYKRIMKQGTDYHLSKLSLDDVNEFINHMISEEIFADKWAMMVFRILNDEPYPIELSQNLHLEEKRNELGDSYAPYHGRIQNSYDNYYNLINETCL